jgi:predicted acylesterase/phospholipase RssA/CRP-like cAMP-binding protein
MLQTLKNMPLLNMVDESRWASLEPYITFRKLELNDTLFSCGQKSDMLYLILTGGLNLYLPVKTIEREVLVNQRGFGDTAGDFAVLNGGEHLVTARASENNTTIACFPRAGFEKLADLDTTILAHVYETAAEQSHTVLLYKSFLSLFGDVSEKTLDELVKNTKIRHLRNGEVLFRQGDKTDGLYIIMAGRLPILIKSPEGHTRTLGIAKPPQMVGEFSLITESARAATVYASRESMVAFLDKELFNKVIMQSPKLLASVSRMIVHRQNASIDPRELTGKNNHIAILSLSRTLPIKRIIHMLKMEVRQSARTLAIDSHQFDTLYGKSDAAQTSFSDYFNSSITAWLDDRESHYGHVLYIADYDWTPWTHRCLNRADRILLLVDSQNSPDLIPLDEKIQSMFGAREYQPRIEYAFLHPEKTPHPTGTAQWLKKRTFSAYHHIRLEDQAHFARLARRITGRATGLILSGGGARGYVHLGVHRAIEQTRLPIDYIGGSSMGALLGGAIAQGLSYQAIFKLSAKFANPRALFDYTLPMMAIMKSAKLTHFCQELYGNTRIEDLWIPYFCMSTNLSRAEEKIHQTGLLWQAVRSSIAIPGIFSPVPQDNGELLVDGAVLNTFPVKNMESLLFGGLLIGVNVSQIEALEDNYKYGTSLSGWKILSNKLNPFSPKIKAPRILETLLRANDIKSADYLEETRRLLDVLIEPEVNTFSLLDFRSFEKISNIGYDAAITALSKINQSKL